MFGTKAGSHLGFSRCGVLRHFHDAESRATLLRRGESCDVVTTRSVVPHFHDSESRATIIPNWNQIRGRSSSSLCCWQ